jgi:hypothetical protein
MGERIRKILRWVLGLDAVDSSPRGAHDPGGVADWELDGIAAVTASTSMPSGRPGRPDSMAPTARPDVPPSVPPPAARSRPKQALPSPIDEVPDYRAWNYRGWKRLALDLFSGRARAGILVEGDLSLAKLRLRSLPPGLIVRGGLDLRQNQRLRRIGDGLTVDGALLIGGRCEADPWPWWANGPVREAQEGQTVVAILARFSRDGQCPLVELPRGVKVGGDLWLQNCRYIERLPDDLQVGASVRLVGCASLTTLPDPFTVKGHLEIIGAPSLCALPSQLQINGDFRLVGVRVKKLSKDLRVGGNLTLDRCSRLAELPEALEVGGSLLVRRCPIGRLPDQLQISGNLRLVGVRVKELPKDLRVEGDLTLDRCSELVELPARLEVGGSLLVRDCPIERLRAGLHVGKDIRIHRARYLESTPEGMSARGDIELADCDSLVRITPGLRVGRDLVAKRCPNLRELPEGLRIPGKLDVQACTSLEHLPGGIQIGFASDRSSCAPALVLADCSALRRIPEGLKVGGPVEIASSGLRELPEQLLRSVRVLWRGGVVPRKFFFQPESLTPGQILSEPNAELRRVMLERAGWEQVLKRANAAILDRDTDAGGERRLIRVFVRRPWVYLQCRCPSTGRQYLIRVPPNTPSCRHAVAWIAGFDDPEAYNPTVET